MTSANSSFFGIAKQNDKATPNTTYKYMLFNNASGAPQPVIVPLDLEAGGGAMLRDMTKAGISSAQAVEFIPRPETLGLLLTGALGTDTTPTGTLTTGGYKHVYKMKPDQFDIPYFTVQVAPGDLWAEQYPACRVAALGLTWRAPGFVRASCAMLGGKPTKVTAPVPATAMAALDAKAPFITASGLIQLPSGTTLNVLSGSFMINNAIPMDDQWTVGSDEPFSLDVTARSMSFQFVTRVADATLYTKMMYDPASGSAWVTDMMREAGIVLTFKSETDIPACTPSGSKFQLDVKQTSASKNTVWTCEPIGLRSGRNLLMAITGTVIAPASGDALTVEMVNDVAAAQ